MKNNNNNINSSSPAFVSETLSDDVSVTSTMTTTSSTDEESSSASSSFSWQDTPIVEPHTGHKTVLVTGGAGFIGSSVAQVLLARGDNVIVVDEVNDYYDTRLKERNLERLRRMVQQQQQQEEDAANRLFIYKADIADKTAMQEIFQKHPQIGWICHMAARAGVRPSIQDPYVYIHSNINGTTVLLDLAAQHDIQNFCFASSSSVYGGSQATYFSEDDIVDNPVSPYAASKKACELLAYTYHHLYNIPVSGLRFFTVYGPNGRPDMAPFKFVDRVARGQVLQQFGDGSSSRDYTYIDDIVDGIIRSLDRPYGYQIFNLGKGQGTSLRDFIRLVEHNVGRQAKIEILPDQPGDVPYTCANVNKAEYLLGYKSKVTFEEGIRRTVEWYKDEYGYDDKDSSDVVAQSAAAAAAVDKTSSGRVVSRTPLPQAASSVSVL